MHRKWLYSLAFCCMAFLQFNCGGCGSDGTDEIFIPEGDDESVSENVNYNSDAMNEVIASFPSPVEMALLVKDSGVPFSNRYLIDPDDVKDYSSSFDKALGLGFLSADLGYLNVYSKTSQILEYLVSIRQLTDDLRLGQFFDFQSLKRLATSEEDLDSLQFMCTESYHNMDEHLRNNQRSKLSVLMVSGVWIESLYLVTQVAKEQPSEEFKNTVGGQKEILNNLLPILKLFVNDSDKKFGDLVQNLEELKESLDVVKITVQVKENVPERTDGVIVQDEESIVTVSDEEIKEIIATTEKIRNKIIKKN